MNKRVSELKPGDRVDLECDVFADNGKHPEFEFETECVLFIEWETKDVIRVEFESGFVCGFPASHLVKVEGT